MAGLLLKELKIRGLVQRTLIVTPIDRVNLQFADLLEQLATLDEGGALSGAEKSWIVLPARITGYFGDLYSGLRLRSESAFEAIACGPFGKS